MKILITGDLTLSKEFLQKYSIQVVEYGNNTHIIVIPENVQIKKNIVTEQHLPKFTDEKLLSEYISSHDDSLKDFIIYKTTIIASGNFEAVEEELNLPYDYVVEGDFRIYDQNQMNTFDFIASSQVDLQEHNHYLERMLTNSTKISSNNKTRKK